jgi:hypothetical protein
MHAVIANPNSAADANPDGTVTARGMPAYVQTVPTKWERDSADSNHCL